MNLLAITLISLLLTLLLIRSGAAVPGLLLGVITVVLMFATWPSLGPAVTHGTAEFAHQLGAATDRAADVPAKPEEVRR